PANLPYLPGTFARRAAVGVRTRLAAARVARLARDQHLEVEGLARAEHDVVEREVEHGFGVGAAGRACGPAAAGAGSTTAAEEGAEELVEAESAGVERAAAAEGPRVRAFRSEHVVSAAAFRIAQRLVRLVDLLETFDRGRIVRVRIGVVLASERAERALDLVV